MFNFILISILNLIATTVAIYGLSMPKVDNFSVEDLQAPSLHDLSPDAERYQEENYLKKVIEPFGHYTRLKRDIESLNNEFIFLLLFVGCPLINFFSCKAALKNFMPDLSGFWTFAIPVLITAAIIALGFVIANLIDKKYAYGYGGFKITLEQCTNDYKQYGGKPEFSISDKKQIENDLFMKHYSFLRRTYPELKTKRNLSIVCIVYYACILFVSI